LHFRSTRTGGGVASSLASSVVSLAGVAGTSIIATGVTAGSSAVIVSNGQAWQVVRVYQQV
jgi:predicted type IV restriction endonuclease